MSRLKQVVLFLFLIACLPVGAANFLYPVTQPIKLYTDTTGKPLNGGYIYFGQPNQNPETSTITMYWDAAGTIPAAQPLRTTNGYIVRQGTPANIYATGDFSITVKDSRGALVFSLPTSTDLQLAQSISGGTTAAAIPIADAGSYYTTDNVEAAFQQLGPLLAQMVTELASTVPTGATFDYSGTTAPTGYVLASGRTIGDASSGSTERANADTVALYTLHWNSYANTELIIQDSAGTPTTRGASASNDYAAHKRLPLPDCRGRIRAGKDNMGGSTASRLTAAGLGSGQVGTTMGAASTGATGFTEAHAMTLGELANHNHTATVTDPGHVHSITDPGHTHPAKVWNQTYSTNNPGGNAFNADSTGVNGATSSATTGIVIISHITGITVANTPAGSNTPFSVVQPTIIFTAIIKL